MRVAPDRLSLARSLDSLFVRLFLGHVNVKVIKSGEKFIMKKEYEKFKGRTNIVMIVGAMVQLFEYPGTQTHTRAPFSNTSVPYSSRSCQR